MTRCLVIGRTGQLAVELARAGAPAGVEADFVGRDTLDLERGEAIEAAIEAAAPDVVLNAAAYTAVEQAETERDRAFAANADALRQIGTTTAARGAAVVHVSTDYVFDGRKNRPYDEQDDCNPLNVYGESKLAGERALAAANPRHVIVRASWLYSASDGNFVTIMRRLAAERDRLEVVDDQIGRPTSAADLARFLWQVVGRIAEGEEPWGLYHFSNGGEPVSWKGFAERILAPLDAAAPPIRAIASADYPGRATRPANSLLSLEKIGRVFGVHPRPWPVALAEVLRQIDDAQGDTGS